MLYFRDADIAFMHVPKNAGKSVRRALEAFGPPCTDALAADLDINKEDAASVLDGQGAQLPGLGMVKPEHLPLAIVAEHLPRTFAQIAAARSFMLVRPPRDRFFSALLQHLREFSDVTALRADDPVVASEARKVCDWLDGRGPFSDIAHIHFSRQIDYAEIDGKRIVSALFPMDRTDAVSAWIKAQTGQSLSIAHDHARREPKVWAGALQPGFRFIGRTLLPPALKKAIYPLWMNSGMFANAAKRYETVQLAPDVEQFLADYYAPDAALYAEACRFAQTLAVQASEAA